MLQKDADDTSTATYTQLRQSESKEERLERRGEQGGR